MRRRGIGVLLVMGLAACGGDDDGDDDVAGDADGDADADVDGDADADADADADVNEHCVGAVVPEPDPAALPPYTVVPYPAENPDSADKAVLGKILFWEEQLSSDDTVACGTCHRAGAGGSDPRASEVASFHPGADGILGTADDPHGGRGVSRCRVTPDGAIERVADPLFDLEPQVTRRKPPTYLDAMFAVSLFWDGRAASEFVDPETGLVAIAMGGALESQAVGPPMADVEMACEDRGWDELTAKLARVEPLALARDLPPDVLVALCDHPTYPELFAAAFPEDPVISARNIAFAIATHERRLISSETPWDRWNNGDPTALTEAQERGRQVFLAPGFCQRCHAPPLFTDNRSWAEEGATGVYSNLGFSDPHWDTGRQEVTGLAEDLGRFKTPTLRNVGLRESGGMLHDGVGLIPGADANMATASGATLEAIVAAYVSPPGAAASGGLGADDNVDPRMTTGLDMTPEQQADLVEFMRHALTDPRVPAEQYPFDRPALASER